ncbi:MAG: glutaredoxin family protein [Gammaproteobacteria bacterium]|nr:glutaredoxin family protein [Gammaproteobacteria bacterium]MDE0479973.1 glutaredoxin family protein [Gammaproteobacteria bacterium]
MPELLFYTTEGCHLCEYAETMLDDLARSGKIRARPVDISKSEELVERYGLTIPVLRNPRSGRELNWPFNTEQIIELLQTDTG